MPGAAAEEARKDDAEAQLQHWEDLKRAERAAKGDVDTSALAGISRGLPEWQRAVKLQHKAAKVGFDWPGPEPVLEKLHEEIEEVRVEFAAVAASPGDAAARDRLEDELGDILFGKLAKGGHVKVVLKDGKIAFEFEVDGAGPRQPGAPEIEEPALAD